MLMTFGNGGWVRVADTDLPGPLYLRYRLAGSRPVLGEFYLDAGDAEISSSLMRDLDLKAYTALIARESAAWLAWSVNHPGPDLSLLASYFGTSFGRQARKNKNWVWESFQAQYDESDVPRPERAANRSASVTPSAPVPVALPEHGLTDDFLRSVADNYAWAVGMGKRPAPMIAAQSQSSVRTVHAWVRKARERGIMPATTQGRVG